MGDRLVLNNQTVKRDYALLRRVNDESRRISVVAGHLKKRRALTKREILNTNAIMSLCRYMRRSPFA